jgi:hypothetical protein
MTSQASPVTDRVRWTDNLGRARDVRSLSNSTCSLESISFLKQRLQHCLKHDHIHRACRPVSHEPPTRLLQIAHRTNADQGQDLMVHLVDGKASVGHGYLTLSHCWGKAQVTTLTLETEPNLRAGISTQALPKTFRDAIYVCDQLDQQYLWIDSLCIRQDDPADWATESAQMHAVYANATCNIAATGAVDSSVGLFFDRNPLAHQPFSITAWGDKWLCLPDWTQHTILESPLNRRSWVAQERFLSSRIMHFTSAGVYWDCNQSKNTELYPTHAPAYGNFEYQRMSNFKNHLGMFRTSKQWRSARPKSEEDWMHYQWMDFVIGYSLCGLTKEADKLIAFNGIAQRMKDCLGANILCGLWEQCMIWELQWEVCSDDTDRQDAPFVLEWRAPSWSWASGDHHLQSSFHSTHHDCTHRKDTAEIAHIEAETLPNGKVESATLVLRGYVTSVKIRSEEGAYRERGTVWTAATCADTEYQIDSSAFNFDRLPETPHEEELTLVALARCNCTISRFPVVQKTDLSRTKKPSLAIMMLRRTPASSPTYTRAGILRLEGDACKLYDENASSATEDLVLV